MAKSERVNPSAPKQETNAIQVSTPSGLPEYMQGDAQMGQELLKQYVVLPRVKIIQKSSDRVFLDQFGLGSVCITPTKELVAACQKDEKGNAKNSGDPFEVVPVFFFPSWRTANDIKARGKEQGVLYYTINPKDPIVAKARDRDRREEQHPSNSNWKIHHVESLNFAVIILDERFMATPALVTFERAEWLNGSKWAGLIRNSRAPIFARKWVLNTAWRPGSGNGDWYGFEISQPQGAPYVSQEMYASLKGLNLELTEKHRTDGLQGAVDDESAPGAQAETAPENTQY